MVKFPTLIDKLGGRPASRETSTEEISRLLDDHFYFYYKVDHWKQGCVNYDERTPNWPVTLSPTMHDGVATGVDLMTQETAIARDNMLSICQSHGEQETAFIFRLCARIVCRNERYPFHYLGEEAELILNNGRAPVADTIPSFADLSPFSVVHATSLEKLKRPWSDDFANSTVFSFEAGTPKRFQDNLLYLIGAVEFRKVRGMTINDSTQMNL